MDIADTNTFTYSSKEIYHLHIAQQETEARTCLGSGEDQTPNIGLSCGLGHLARGISPAIRQVLYFRSPRAREMVQRLRSPVTLGRGPWFGSRHPRGGLNLIPVTGYLMPNSDL